MFTETLQQGTNMILCDIYDVIFKQTTNRPKEG